jgi:hypothetical protein
MHQSNGITVRQNHQTVLQQNRHIPAVATATKDGRSRLESRHSAARWLPEREQRIAELEQEIDRLQRTEEAIVVATGAARERGCPPWVVLGVKAVEVRGPRAA